MNTPALATAAIAPETPEVFFAEPERLASGRWNHQLDKQIGEGDIAASYSAERIAYGQPIRRPFLWQGGLWISVGSCTRSGEPEIEAYRLVNPKYFPGTPTTYAEKTADSDAARSDPQGFYHGMEVASKGGSLILSGPPAIFRPGEKAQGELF